MQNAFELSNDTGSCPEVILIQSLVQSIFGCMLGARSGTTIGKVYMRVIILVSKMFQDL